MSLFKALAEVARWIRMIPAPAREHAISALKGIATGVSPGEVARRASLAALVAAGKAEIDRGFE